jgi:hypothetical protein
MYFIRNVCRDTSLARLKVPLFHRRRSGYSDNHSVPDVMCRSVLL